MLRSERENCVKKLACHTPGTRDELLRLRAHSVVPCAGCESTHEKGYSLMLDPCSQESRMDFCI